MLKLTCTRAPKYSCQRKTNKANEAAYQFRQLTKKKSSSKNRNAGSKSICLQANKMTEGIVKTKDSSDFGLRTKAVSEKARSAPCEKIMHTFMYRSN